jgi:hypothetical protein
MYGYFDSSTVKSNWKRAWKFTGDKLISDDHWVQKFSEKTSRAVHAVHIFPRLNHTVTPFASSSQIAEVFEFDIAVDCMIRYQIGSPSIYFRPSA